MYNELNDILNDYANENINMLNEWYESISDDAVNIISNFKTEDWNDLMKNLSFKSTSWLKRLVECLPYNEESINILKSLSYTDDIDLFSIVISKMANFDEVMINNRQYIEEKINRLMPNANSINQSIFNYFLNKSNKTK